MRSIRVQKMSRFLFKRSAMVLFFLTFLFSSGCLTIQNYARPYKEPLLPKQDVALLTGYNITKKPDGSYALECDSSPWRKMEDFNGTILWSAPAITAVDDWSTFRGTSCVELKPGLHVVKYEYRTDAPFDDFDLFHLLKHDLLVEPNSVYVIVVDGTPNHSLIKKHPVKYTDLQLPPSVSKKRK